MPIISQVHMGEYEASGLHAHVVIRRRRALGRYDLMSHFANLVLRWEHRCQYGMYWVKPK